MNLLKLIVDRFLQERPFFYGWEQRAFERRREQFPGVIQNPCRFGRD